MKTFIIAEAGANHNRNFNQALALIDAASAAEADAVKFQTYSSETLYSQNTPDFAGYKNINNLIKEIELPREWQKDLKDYCDDKQIEFMSTPFDEKAVEQLVSVGVKRLKIAGFEATDLRFVDMVASTNLPLIISAGIGCDLDFIEKIIRICHAQKNYDLTILHCNNAYPTPPQDINLNTLRQIKKRYGKDVKVGLSDHTMNTLTPALAVALGAQVIEKHYTLSKQLPGPDHAFALECTELKEMIENVRVAEMSLGIKKTKYTESEESFAMAGRSIVAKTSIKAGDTLNTTNLTTKRPFLEGNHHASEWFDVVGLTAKKDYLPDSFI